MRPLVVAAALVAALSLVPSGFADRFSVTVDQILAQPYQADYMPLGPDTAFDTTVHNTLPAEDYTTGSIPDSPDYPAWPAAFSQVLFHSSDGAPLFGMLALHSGHHPGVVVVHGFNTHAILNADDLLAVTVADCQRAAGELVGMKSKRGRPYAAATIANYWQAFEQLLDHVGADPNPARDKRIRLPKLKRTPPTVPTADHVTVMLQRIATKYVLPMVTIEQTAMRVESIETLTWGVVDVRGSRVRLDEKGGKIRWADLPRWLTRQLEDTCPVEDRLPDRRLYPSITTQGLRGAMATACRLGRIPHYHPHDLRHRRASLWHLQHIPDAVLAERLGHERASFSKDVYVHVMPVEEIPAERLEAIVAEARA